MKAKGWPGKLARMRIFENKPLYLPPAAKLPPLPEEGPVKSALRMILVTAAAVAWILFCLFLLAIDPYGPHMQ